jgi:hypothetical protein
MRKLYFLTIVMVSLSFISNAQISKGSTFLGGSVNVNTNSSKDENPSSIEDRTSNWGIRPQIGKAIATNKILGVFLNYSSSENQYASYPFTGTFPITPTKFNNENTSYGGGFFYRHYYPLSNRFFLFGEGSVGGFFGKTKRQANDHLTEEIESKDFNLGVTPGISFAATRKLHLEASLNSLFSVNYGTSKTTEFNTSGGVSGTKNGHSFSGNANANGFSGLAIGLRWILPSKK